MPTPRKLAPLFRSKLLAGSALCGALALMPAARALALPAPINPTTAQSGGADLPPTITVTASTMTVAADAQNTFIQWRSYTVASGETVDYTLPSASSIVLNVLPVGTKADIEGDLNAYIGSVGGAFGGNVWFSAPSGMIFGAGAVINVGGLLATTASPNEKLFLTEGNIPPGLDAESSYAFFAPGINGVLFAQGPITVTGGAQINAAGSLVALISPTVVVQAGATITNSAGSGVFVHDPGGVLYGAADTYTVSLIQESQGDLDLLKFVIGTPADVSATPLTLLGTTNGANVYVASLSASTIANAVVNAGGLIEATKVQAGLSGEVILSTASDTLVPGQFPTATSLTISPADLELGDIAAAADLKALSSGNLTIGAGSLVGAAAGMTLQAQGDITLGGALSAPGNAVALTAGGDIDQTGGIITAGNLSASAATGISLADANDAGAVTLANTTSGDVDYVSGQTTSVASAADPAGAISLSTTAGDLDLAGNVNAGANPVTLGAAGDIAQSAGIITADTLSASAATGISLTDANAAGNITLANTASGDVGYVGGQTTTVLSASDAGGNVALTTLAGDLDLIGAVSAGANAVTLSAAAGDIDQIGGIVTAGSLSASAGDGVSLADANAAAKVSLANSDFGVVDYVSAIALDVLSAGNTGGAVSISTTSGDLDTAGTVSASGNLANIDLAAAGNLGLGGAVSTPGNAVTLSAGGNIDQTAGIITATTLTATAATGLDLPDANAVTTVGDLANSTSGDIDYASAGSVAITAASDPAGNVSLTANAGSLTLSAATAGLDLSLSAVGGEVDVTPSAPVTVGKDYFATGETFSADALGIDPPGNVTIVGTGPSLDVSGAAIAAGDNVSITADNGLLTAGAVTAGAGNISLASIAGGVDLGGTLDAGAQSVTLAAAAGVDQTAGVITAGNLKATAATGVSLTDANAAGTVALANSTSGAIDYVSGQSTTILSATGPAGAVSISTTVGDLDLAGAVNAGTNGVTLTAAGDVDQTAGVITAGSLGASAATGISLADANRAGTVTLANSTSGDVTYVSAIGLDVLSASNGGDALSISTTAGGLSTTATVSAGADVTLASAANLALGGDVIAPATVTLTAAGDIDQTSGTVFAASLAATAATGISLADDNAASDLTLANSTSGDVTYVSGVGLDVLSARNGGGSVSISTTPGDTDDLSTTGTVSASGNVTLASAGNLALGADVSAPGNTVTLTAAGGIGQTAGIVTAGALAATAATGISLADANAAGTVALANSTSGAIDYVSGQSTTVLSATGPAGAVSISTTVGNLDLAGAVNAGTSAVTLTAAGDIGQTAGIITAGALSASAATGISLADANAAGTVTLANSTSGDVDYVSGQTTTIVSVSDPAGNISLATLQSPGGPAVDLTADQVVAGGSISADVQGTLTIGSATSPVSITTQSDNLVITRQLAAPVVTVESLLGAITVGGAATATGFGLSEASFANIDAADALNIYAGSTASAARGNMTLLDLAIDPARTPNVNLYAAPGAAVLVAGAVTPTASGGALTIGGDAGSGWQPGSILISGSLGAAQWVNETSFADVDAFGAVSLSAGAILMGSPAFIASVEAMTPAQIDALDDFPPAVQASGAEIGHEFVVAGVLDLTASGEVVQQNTSGARGTFAGVFLTNNTASPGVVLNIDPPTLVELFGSVVAKNGQIISGPTAAASPVLRVNVPGLSFDASLNDRFNGCPIGPVSLTCGGEIVDVGDTFDPSQEFQQSSVAAAESAALSDVFANPPLLEAPPLTGGDQSVDVIPAGSGNEEIWRGSKRHSP